MKRSIIFLIILVALLLTAVTAEYLYSKSLKHKANDIISEYSDADSEKEYDECADRLHELIDHRQFINRLFYSKDLTDKIMSEIEKMRHLSGGDNIADAKAQLESVKYLFGSLYRFNADQ